KFDFNLYRGSGKVTRMMHLLNTKQYLEMRREAFSNDSATASISNAPDLIEWDTTKYTDWQKVLIGGISNIQDIQGSISGGNLNTQFFLGGGYHRETTVFPGSNADQKSSLHLNLTHSSDDHKFKLNFTASFVANNNNILAQDITAFSLYLPPNTPDLIKSDGTLVWPDGLYLNPFAFLLQKYKENTYNLISNGMMSYILFPGLSLKMSAGFTQMQTSQVQTDPLSSYNPLFGLTSGDAAFSNNSIRTWILEPQIGWHKCVGKHNIDLLAGSTFQEDIRQEQTLDATNFSSESLLENIAAAGNINPVVSTYLPYKYNAFFSRFTYNYAEKYLLNITGRRDGSSRFGPDKQFANFGAIGVGWIFSKEDFIHKAFSFLSYGKIKASYGTAGNDQIGDYQYLATYSPTIYPYQNQGGLYPTSLFNPDFSWETNKKAEISLEVGMLKDRILFTGSFYRNRSSNQLVGYPLPLITGGSSVQSNLPAVVQNSGLEIELNTNNIKTKNFTWNSSLTLSIPRNKLLSYPNLDQSAYANTYVVGKSLFIKKLSDCPHIGT
ncbi:MAG TPA: hypothetical protein VK772_03615, partial [Puia sp.]|nr:hypothetical protein [Puia sp.]